MGYGHNSELRKEHMMRRGSESHPHPRPLSLKGRGEARVPSPQRGVPLRVGYAQG